MFKWRLYYEDGSTFDNIQGKPHEAPMFPRVQIVGQPGVRERIGFPDIVEGMSFFLYRTDLNAWLGYEQESFLYDEFERVGHLIGCFRKGRHIGEGDYRDIWNRVRADLGLKLQR